MSGMVDSIACPSIIDLFSNIFFTTGVNFNFGVNPSLMHPAGLVSLHLYFGLVIYIYASFLEDIVPKITLDKKHLPK